MAVVAVRGESMRDVEPELAEFQVVVGARDRDRQATLTRLRERADALRAFLDRYGEAIERRESTGLYVHPEGGRRGERVTAYTGSVTTAVVVHDLAALGEMMLALADQDQTVVYGPTWSIRPDSPVHRDARRAAVAEAVTRAHEYAAALGATVTELIELSDAGLGRPPDFPMAAGFGAQTMRGPGGAPELQLDPQRQQVYAAVEARFAITTPTNLNGA